jgi:uncharacterized iron-regulated protein
MRSSCPATWRSPTSTRRFASLLAALSSAALAACAPLGALAPGHARILDVHAARFVDEAVLVADLASARYRLLGEIHDDPAHHTIRARLIRAIAATGLRPAVVLEQFDLDHDAALRAAQQAGADPEKLADAGRLDREGWEWPMHEPILATALAMHLPIRAGNLPRAAGGAGGPLVADPNADARARIASAPWTQAQERTLREEIAESHCGALPPALVPRLAAAQRIRDAAMAQSLVDAATADGVILIAGNGHVRADLGVPVYLHAPGSPNGSARSVSVGFIEVSPDDEARADAVRRLVDDHPGFDYLWLTAPVERDDPCKAFSPAAPSRRSARDAQPARR